MCIDHSDWGIRPETARVIQNRFGYANVDLFADSTNAKCSRFVAKFPSQGAIAADAFSVPFGFLQISCGVYPQPSLFAKLFQLRKCWVPEEI